MLNTEKRRRLIRQFIEQVWLEGQYRYFEVWKNWDSKDENFEIHAFDVLPYQIGLVGRGLFIVEENNEECKKVWDKVNPDRDWGLAEIFEFKGYTIWMD